MYQFPIHKLCTRYMQLGKIFELNVFRSEVNTVRKMIKSSNDHTSIYVFLYLIQMNANCVFTPSLQYFNKPLGRQYTKLKVTVNKIHVKSNSIWYCYTQN